MSDKSAILRALGSYTVPPIVLVEDQNVTDIIKYLKVKHRECVGMYDRIAEFFEYGTQEEICYQLWAFCRKNLPYYEEDEEEQMLSTPREMLSRGFADCKGYALFIGGVLGALNRKGYDIDWVYRFVPSSMISANIGHVFVCVDPMGENIWVDPVLGTFDQHFIFLVKKDERVGEAVGRKVAGLQPLVQGRAIGLTKPEQNLLDQLNEYTLGLENAMQLSTSTNTFNTITQGVLATASTFVPGVAAALAILKVAQGFINNAFGVGSTAARLLADVTNNLLLAPYAIVKTLLNPGARTFESDNYEGARFYFWFVEGNKKYTNTSQVADTDVIVGLKWFIDRLGVFISGQEHIFALIKSPQDYINLHSVNAYTTTNLAAVTAASLVAQTYFNMNGAAGSWANTEGVFDATLVNIAASLNESVEQVNSQVQSGELTVPGEGADTASGTITSILQNPILWVGAAIGLAILLTSKPSKSGK